MRVYIAHFCRVFPQISQIALIFSGESRPEIDSATTRRMARESFVLVRVIVIVIDFRTKTQSRKEEEGEGKGKFHAEALRHGEEKKR